MEKSKSSEDSTQAALNLPEDIQKRLKEWAESDKPQNSPPVVKNASLKIGKNKIDYTVETGLLTNQTEKKDAQAKIFYCYYKKKGARTETRPLTFVFNGGPGSSSVWLHLGVLGPKIVRVDKKGTPLGINSGLKDNEQSFLAFSDLVFIDPAGTGFSRVQEKEKEKEFYNVKGDLESVGRFIYDFLGKKHRWQSPLFLCGESYGTTRAVGLASHLHERYGINFHGLLLISLALNFRTLFWGPPQDGDDLTFALYLPTYAATSWFHKVLPAKSQKRALKDLLKEVEDFALGPYLQALTLGTSISEELRKLVTEKLHLYTGLPEKHITQHKLRLDLEDYVLHALPGQRIGRLDSRFVSESHASKHIDKALPGGYVDPSFDVLYGTFTAAINDYLRRELGFESEDVYEILSISINEAWKYQNQGDERTPQLGHELTKAMLANPRMKVFVASGLYDFATPHFAGDYTVNHLGLGKDMRPRLSTHRYEAGHMMYIEESSRKSFVKEARSFIESCL